MTNSQTILYGQYEITPDAQGCWAVPARFAAALAQGGVMTAGLDGCLWLYPLAGWQSLVERISPRLALTNAAAREFTRFIFGHAHTLTLDGGRLELPPALRRLAGIGDALVMAGLLNRLELWSPERWQAQLAHASSAWQASLSELGI